MINIGEWVNKRALLNPEHRFLKQDDWSCDNAEFSRRVAMSVGALRRLGLQPGDRVATVMENGSAFLELLFACAAIGAILVPINPNLASAEAARLLADCSPRIGICSSRFATMLSAVNNPAGTWFEHAGGTLAAAHALAPQPPDPGEGPPVCREAALDDPLLIMYTSGTTGTLKGALLSHGNLLFGAIHSLLSYNLDPGLRSLVVAPLFHIGALAASVLPIVYAGGSLVIHEFSNPSETLDLIGREKINYLFAVPVMFGMMARSPAWPRADFTHMRLLIAGGAAMPVDLIRHYQEEKQVRFAQGYGMTETQRIAALDLESTVSRAGSIGKEVFHTHLRLVGEDGQEVPPGEAGEIVVKGPTVFLGYWNQPRATARVLRDGWFHTGDLGRRDEAGYLYIVGRKSDVIISAGENIYAAQVEQAMQSLPEVAEAAVFAVADPQRGEAVAAAVVLQDGADCGTDHLLAQLKGIIADFKRPRKIWLVDALPRNDAGKVLKEQLKNHFQ